MINAMRMHSHRSFCSIEYSTAFRPTIGNGQPRCAAAHDDHVENERLEMNEQLAAEIARIIAADTNLKVELDLPANTEIRVAGKPILALNPATNNLTVPAPFLHHPLVRGRYYCSLPRALWDETYERIGQERFDEELVNLEYALSEICGDHSRIAGFRNGQAITYSLLRRPLQLSLQDVRSAGIDVDQRALNRVVQTAEKQIGGMAKVARAYAGWLMTNPQFLDEHDALTEEWSQMIRRWGLDRLGILMPSGTVLPGDDPTGDDRWSAYRAAFEEFFSRWRLQGLAAPYLPVPLQPLMGGMFPVSILPQLMRSGGVFVLPDTFPIPSRDTLRNMLEHALHCAVAPEHLHEWMAIIAGDNPAKKQLLKFSRLFEVQHYYRILQHRHAPALRRKLSIVKDVFSEFLNTARRTIDDDFKYIKRRLGPEWIDRGSQSSLGPFGSISN